MPKGIYVRKKAYKLTSKVINHLKNIAFKKGHGLIGGGNRGKKHPEMSNENHPEWKGIFAKRVAKHQWVQRRKGKPKFCEHCGIKDKNKVYDWANIDHKYKRNIDDYIRLCRSCHRKYDMENNNYKVAYLYGTKHLSY